MKAVKSTKKIIRRLLPSFAAVLILCAAALALGFVPKSQAVTDPAELLTDPAQEAQAERIGARLRCLVCQNESIEDSAAPLAHDLRRIVREQLKQGKNEAQILAWMQKRYGEFVRLDPVFDASTALLWLMPLLALAAGCLLSLRFWKRARYISAPLTAEERHRLEALLPSHAPHDKPRETL